MPRFIWPVPYNLSQGWGADPAYYKQFGELGHNGYDLAHPLGTPVYASADGTVKFVGKGVSKSAGYSGWMGDPAGNAIIIDHGDVYTGYAHLNQFAIGVGEQVSQGQLIGFVGMTGAASGPHLHFEFIGRPPNWNNGFAARLDPANYNVTEGGTSMAEKANLDTARILAHGILGRNGIDGRGNALDGSSDADLNNGAVGSNLTDANIMALYMSAEAKAWRDSQDSNSVNGINSRLGQLATVNAQFAKDADQIAQLAKDKSDLVSQVSSGTHTIAAQAATIQSTQAQVDELTAKIALQSDDTTNLNGLGVALQWAIKRLGLSK